MSSTNRPLLGQDARNLPISDDEVVRRVRAGETGLFEVVMRRYNQRLYRVARAILRDDAEAEDVTQQAYVNAYRHLDQFAGRAMFSTWLTRIAVHEAFARARRRGRFDEQETVDDWDGDIMDALRSPGPDPERQAFAGEHPVRIVHRHLRDGDAVGTVVHHGQMDAVGCQRGALDLQALDRRHAFGPQPRARLEPHDRRDERREQ